VRKGAARLGICEQEHHRVQDSRIYAECGTSQRGGRQDKREDERKLETWDLWRAVPAWREMWNERPKTKVGIRTSQWRGGGRSGLRGKTVCAGFLKHIRTSAGQIQTDTDGPTALQFTRGRAGILRCWMLNVGRRAELDKNNYSSNRAGAWSSKESMSQEGR
jgi:hypothetical protein